MTVFTIIFYSFVSILLFYGFYLMLDDDFDFHKKYYGRNHCGIVCYNGSGGDIHFDEMTDEEIYERLKNDYFIYREFDCPCYNTKDKSHLAEYRILLRDNKVKTIGYITKDKVVFEGKEYIFQNERIDLEEKMKDSLHKSIAEIMTFFDFEKVAKIEETFFNEFAENEDDELIDIIKEFALENLYKCAEEFSDKKCNCWSESKYHLRFEYVYDENGPYIELRYVPISWER